MKASSPARKRALYRTPAFWVIIVILLAAGGGAAWYLRSQSLKAQASSAAAAAAKASTTTVKLGNINKTASGSGTLSAETTVDLSFSTSGTVADLNVKAGDTVKKGDILARLGNASDLEAKVSSAQLTLLKAQQALTKLQTNSSVALADAYQSLVTAQQTYADALNTAQRVDYARCTQETNARYLQVLTDATTKLTKLKANGDTTSSQLEDAQNDYDTAFANYNYCISYTTDEKTSAKADLQVAKTALDQAQTTYDKLKTSSGIDPDALALDEAAVKNAQDQLAEAQDNLAGITLTAPIDGKVVYLAASKDNYVDTSTYITIAAMDKMTVSVSIDEADQETLKVGNSATLTFDALPNRTLKGTVTQVNPTMTQSGQYRVVTGKIELDADSVTALQNVPLGISATITIYGDTASNVLVVPSTAVKTSTDGTTSVTLVSNGVSAKQVVSIGLDDGTNTQIVSGLKEGDTILSGTTTSSSTSSQNQGFPGGDFGGMMPPQ